MISDKFLNFGGHKMAAGFAFDSKIISFEMMRKEINRIIEEQTQGFDFSPILNIDMPLEAQDLSFKLVDDIEKLQPFGADNQPPVFALQNLVLKNYKLMGANANHLKMFLETPLKNTIECVKWNVSGFNMPLESKLDIAFSPKINVFNGNTTLQIEVFDIHSDSLKEDSPLNNTLKILDHRKKTDIFERVIEYLTTTKVPTGIFAVNKKTINLFDKYDNLKNKIYNEGNLNSEIDQIMFFDCPESEERLREIIDTSGAKTLHFMRFNPQVVDTQTFIATLSGMIKYCVNNKNGLVDIPTLTRTLNTGEETTKLALTLLEQAEMISLESEDEVNYKIEFKKPVKLSDIESQELYRELDERIKETNAFKKQIFEASVEELHAICENRV